jgi:asparagine synthase (glutamine-hydrolysing)
MCGFFGVYGKKVSNETKDKVNKLLMHRGPDGYGYYEGKLCNTPLFILHRRLAIIDINDRSHQPFKKSNLVLVFNGEIYNYKEVKNELIKLGHNFYTESDTEVVLEAYLEWGTACVKRFEGMWAIIVVDNRNQNIWISRDRFGEKPLYWHFSDKEKCLYFASEIKILTEILNEKIDPNLLRIQNYLVNGYRSLNKNNQSSWFNEINLFDSGSSEIINEPKRLLPLKFWNLEYKPNYKICEEDIFSELQYKFNNALGLRLRSDVPIAYSLSGGIDSSLLVCNSLLEKGNNLKCFSIIDSDNRYNELKGINEVNKKLNITSQLIYLDNKNFIENMREIVRHRNSPISTISYYAHNLMVKEISKNGYKVVISGTGADELFSGYYDHYNFWLAEFNTNKNINEWKLNVGSHVRNKILKDPNRFKKFPNDRSHLYEENDFFKKFLVCSDGVEPFYESRLSENDLRNRMMNELFYEIVPVILYEDDLNSMMYGIENRSPYLDKSLVEFAYTIPNQYLIKNGLMKWPLRKIGLNKIPENIRLNSEKKGFNASINTLLDKKNKKIIDYLLSDSKIFEIIDFIKFQKYLRKDINDNHQSKFLFNFISAKIFLDEL